MDPLVSVANIIRAAAAVARLIETIKLNNHQWAYLQQRVVIIRKIMGIFVRLYDDNTPIPDVYEGPLRSMEDALNKAQTKLLELEAQRPKTKITKAIFLADYHDHYLAFLNMQISNAMLALSLGLSMQEVIEKKGQTEGLKEIAEKRIAALEYELEQLEQKALKEKESKVISFCELSIETLMLEFSRVKVYTGYCFKNLVAIRLLKGILTEEDRHEFIQEVRNMGGLSSPYILPIYYICVEPSSLSLVTKYTPQGSLKELLYREHEKGLPLLPKYQQQWGLEIALGLYYLHKENYTHRRLTSKSVLIDEDGHALLTDFHLSQKNILSIFWDEEDIAKWTAPELLVSGEGDIFPTANANVYRFGDVYSFGMVLWEIMTGKTPYQDWNKKTLLMRILEGDRETIPSFVPESYSKIIENCWEKDWLCRKSISDIVDLLRSFNHSNTQALQSNFFGIAAKKEEVLERENQVELIERVVDAGNEDERSSDDQMTALENDIFLMPMAKVVGVESEDEKSSDDQIVALGSDISLGPIPKISGVGNEEKKSCESEIGPSISSALLIPIIEGIEGIPKNSSLSQIKVKEEINATKSIEVLEDKSTLKKFSASKDAIAKRTLKHTRRSDSETSANEVSFPRELNNFQLGKMYAEGRGVQQNTAKALQLLMEAAYNGKHRSEARFYLGSLYAAGLHGCHRNETVAMKWFNSIATDLVGLDSDSLYYLGTIYEKDYIKKKNKIDYIDYKDEAKARGYFLKAAQQGHAEAQYHLALMYLQGRGGDFNEEEAISWFKQAASQGYTYDVGAEIISKEMPKLIAAITQILGQNYKEDVEKMFSQLWHEGIPPLQDETLYNYKYEIYASKREIPPVKKRGIVYLYVENRVLHYQIVRQQEVRCGTLEVEASFNLDKLMDVSFVETLPLTEKIRQIWYTCSVPQTSCIYAISADNGREVKASVIEVSPQNSKQEIQTRLLELAREQGWCLPKEENLQLLEKELERQLKDKKELEPSYEVNFTPKMLLAYREVLTEETKLLDFLSRFLVTLQCEEFKDFLEGPQEVKVLENAIADLQKLKEDQIKISSPFRQNPSDSSEIIDILKSAYENRINFENYLKFAHFIDFLHFKLNKIELKDKIYRFCQKNEAGLSSNVLTNLPAISTAQFMTRKVMVLNNLASCFRKKHDKIYQLDNIFFVLNKLVTLLERAQPPSSQPDQQDEKINLDSMKEINSKLVKEKNNFKKQCFELTTPIFKLLMLEINRADVIVFCRTFSAQKRELINSFSSLEEWFLTKEQIKEVKEIKRKVAEAQDLVCLITCIIDLLTLFPEINEVKNIENTNPGFTDLSSLQTPDRELISPRQHRASRVGDLLEKLSPRGRQISSPVDDRMRKKENFDRVAASKSPLRERNSSLTTGGNSGLPSASFFSNDSSNKREVSPLAQSCSMGGSSQWWREEKTPFPISLPLSLEDKEEKRKKGYFSLTESCDGISRSKVANSSLESRNRVSSVTSPRWSQSRPAVIPNEEPSCSSMSLPQEGHHSKPAVTSNEEQSRSLRSSLRFQMIGSQGSPRSTSPVTPHEEQPRSLRSSLRFQMTSSQGSYRSTPPVTSNAEQSRSSMSPTRASKE